MAGVVKSRSFERLCWPHLWRHLRSYKVSSSCNPFDFLRHPLVCLWGFLLVYGIFLPCPVMLGAHDADYLIAGLRSNILSLHYEDRATPKQRTYVSAVSGGIAGGTVTRLMGGRLIPGVVVFSLLGYLGQRSYNAIDSWQIEHANTPWKPILQRIADSKWIPLKTLSDDEYRGILGEKLLSIEAEIAIIDEKIEELEKVKANGQSTTGVDPSSTR